MILLKNKFVALRFSPSLPMRVERNACCIYGLALKNIKDLLP